MQEKVHGAPPTIKIFEGKTPPTSWFTQNIIKYEEIQSKIAFLKDVVTYMQQLQSESLQESRVAVAMPIIKEALLPLPEEGSAADLANTMTFNATQDYLKTEIEYLEKLINVLKAGNPSLNQKFDSLLTQLKGATQAFPRLSSQQLLNLSSLLEELTDLTKNSPNETQRNFWNTQLRMLQRLMTSNQTNIKEAQEDVKTLEGRIQMLTFLEELLKEMNNTLRAHPPKPAQFLQLIENLQNLANHYGQLNPDQQQALGSFFQQLTEFKTTHQQKLTEIAADALIQSKMLEFLKNHPQATPAQIAEHLRSFLKQSNLQNSPLPFMKDLGQAIENVVNRPEFPTTSGFSGLPFITDEKKLKPSEEMIGALLAPFSPQPESVKATEQTTQSLLQTILGEKQKSQTAIEGYQIAIQNLKRVQQNFSKSAVWGVGKALGAGQPTHPQYGAAAPSAGGLPQEPLPGQFANAILHHFMPGQEKYLQDLALILFLDNMGAQFGNVILNDMLGFAQAASKYTLNQFFRTASDGNFTGYTQSQAKAKISQEKTQCSTDTNACNKTLADLQKQLEQIKEKLKTATGPERAQLKKMKEQNEQQQANLNVTIGYLNDLKTLLEHLQVGPPAIPPVLAPVTQGPTTDYSHEYTVQFTGPPPVLPVGESWQTYLGKCEGYVINGNPDNPKGDPPAAIGGLVHTQAEAQKYQQGYADQGQNQQMKLQMKMTEIQQEWTVVSTALQMLNQMYMAVAQGIYK